MKKIDKRIIDKLFLIIMSVQTFLMGLFFIIQVLRIYYLSDTLFNPDIIKKYLIEVLPVFIIWFVLIICSSIYFYYRKLDNSKKNKIKNFVIYDLLIKKIKDFDNENLKEQYNILNKENKNRLIIKIINIVILVICGVMSLCYLLNVKHFIHPGDISGQIKTMTYYLLPWCIISFVSFLLSTIYCERSLGNSIKVLKEIIKVDGVKKIDYQEKNKDKIINIARAAILTISIVCIIVGIFNGGAKDVLYKAINICTECIGLG